MIISRRDLLKGTIAGAVSFLVNAPEASARQSAIGQNNTRYVSHNDEIRLGDQASQQVDTQYLKQMVTVIGLDLAGLEYYRLSNIVSKKSGVTSTLSNIIREEYQAENGYNMEFKFHVINSKEINAFALPNGKIYVYTGLLDVIYKDLEDVLRADFEAVVQASRDHTAPPPTDPRILAADAELASVLAHEASHVVKRHSAKGLNKRVEEAMTASLVLAAGEATIGQNASNDQKTLAELMAQLVINWRSIGYTKKEESEADKTGFGLLVQAGYAPMAMANLFEKMKNKIGETKNGWLPSDHPSFDERIKNATQWAQQQLPSIPAPNPAATLSP